MSFFLFFAFVRGKAVHILIGLRVSRLEMSLCIVKTLVHTHSWKLARPVPLVLRLG